MRNRLFSLESTAVLPWVVGMALFGSSCVGARTAFAATDPDNGRNIIRQEAVTAASTCAEEDKCAYSPKDAQGLLMVATSDSGPKDDGRAPSARPPQPRMLASKDEFIKIAVAIADMDTKKCGTEVTQVVGEGPYSWTLSITGKAALVNPANGILDAKAGTIIIKTASDWTVGDIVVKGEAKDLAPNTVAGGTGNYKDPSFTWQWTISPKDNKPCPTGLDRRTPNKQLYAPSHFHPNGTEWLYLALPELPGFPSPYAGVTILEEWTYEMGSGSLVQEDLSQQFIDTWKSTHNGLLDMAEVNKSFFDLGQTLQTTFVLSNAATFIDKMYMSPDRIKKLTDQLSVQGKSKAITWVWKQQFKCSGTTIANVTTTWRWQDGNVEVSRTDP